MRLAYSGQHQTPSEPYSPVKLLVRNLNDCNQSVAFGDDSEVRSGSQIASDPPNAVLHSHLWLFRYGPSRPISIGSSMLPSPR